MLHRPGILAFTVAALVATAPAADAADRCAAAKMQLAGAKVREKATCGAKAAGKGRVDPGCLRRAEARFSAGFARAEAKLRCRTTADAPAVEAVVDDFLAHLGGAPAPAGKALSCAATKRIAAGEAAEGTAECQATALASGLPVDPKCTARQAAKLTRQFRAAEAAGGCSTSGDAPAVLGAIAAFVARIGKELETPLPGCSGTCNNGSFCDGPKCSSPLCHAPDSLVSLLVCGGLVDTSCGPGFCAGSSYCSAGTLPACVGSCLAPTAPLSQVVCGGSYSAGCGIGTCLAGSYCDDCTCYAPGSSVSRLFCGCRISKCGEFAPGCGAGTCVGPSFCDNCLCYSPGAGASQGCCPGGRTAFQKIYVSGKLGYDHAIAGRETLDQGFILAGFKGNGAAAIRTDSNGGLVWMKSFAAGAWWAVTETPGGFVLAGMDRLVKTDPGGTVVWARVIPGTAYAVEVTQDGGLIVAGAANDDAYLLKTDADGNLQWGATYGGSGIDEGRSVVETPTGFLLLGSTTSFGAGGTDLFLVNTDSAGALVWAKTIGGSGDEVSGLIPYRMIRTKDGGFAIATSTTSFGQGGQDVFVVKLDQSADVTWAKAYGGPHADEANAIGETLHGFFVMGEEMSFGKGIFLLSLDPDGTRVWSRGYGPDKYFNYLDGGVAFDGGAFIISESHTFPLTAPSHWMYLLKTDPDGRTRGCCNVTDTPLVETTVTVQAVLQPGVVRVALPPTLPAVTMTGTPYPLHELPLCESSAAYLCNDGILNGDCP
jgi:hypothetical protein